MRALWIEIEDIVIKIDGIESRPVRALWIEIRGFGGHFSGLYVEAREGLVD